MTVGENRTRDLSIISPTLKSPQTT